MTPEGMERAAVWLSDAAGIVVSTGAGMSRESGIPTFRDAQDGLWAHFDPQQLATEAGFRAAPARVWGWYAYRRARIRACRPHAGHQAVAQLQAVLPAVTVVTQNVDGFHQDAGAHDVIELHGNIHRNRCIDCRAEVEDDPHTDPDEAPGEREPPRCAACGGYIRPGVVWFGEALPVHAAEKAWRQTELADVLLVIGTSGLVWPAAALPRVAREAGARVIEINPVPSELTPYAHLFLDGPAGEILPALLDRVRALLQPPFA